MIFFLLILFIIFVMAKVLVRFALKSQSTIKYPLPQPVFESIALASLATSAIALFVHFYYASNAAYSYAGSDLFLVRLVFVFFPWLFVSIWVVNNMLLNIAQPDKSKRKIRQDFLIVSLVSCVLAGDYILLGIFKPFSDNSGLSLSWRTKSVEPEINAGNMNTSTEELDGIYKKFGSKNPRILRLLSLNPHTSSATLTALAFTDGMKLAVASNINTPDSALARLSDDADAKIRQAVALNPLVSCGVLEKLVSDKDGVVRKTARAVYNLRSEPRGEDGYFKNIPEGLAVRGKPSFEHCGGGLL